jgi:predicted DNA-binding protein
MKKPRSPRIQVTLSPESRHLFEKLSELTGQSQSAMLAEIADTALPALQVTVDALEAAKAGKYEEVRRLTSHFAHKATGDLAQQMLDLDADMDARTVKGKRKKKGQANGPP